MKFIQRWFGFTSFSSKRIPASASRRRPARMAVEALEDRLTPSGSPLTLLDGKISLSELQSALVNVINEIPTPLPPISLPPGWTGGQPSLPVLSNGIFAADVTYVTATGQTLSVPAQDGLLTFTCDLAGNTLQVTAINGSASNVGVAITLSPSGSTLTANADGSFTYVPAVGFQGDDSFNFTVSDGANSATVTADIVVTGPQIFLPTASFTTAAGQTLNVSAADGLLNGAVATSGNALQVTGVSAAGVLPSSYYWDSIQPVGGGFLNAVSNAAIAKEDFYGFLMPGTLFLPTENLARHSRNHK